MKATLTEKISEIGGVLGLYNGFSVITLVEILYFLFRALLIIIQGFGRRFGIDRRIQDWLQSPWKTLRQGKQNLVVKSNEKREKEESVDKTTADTSKPKTDEIEVVDIE